MPSNRTHALATRETTKSRAARRGTRVAEPTSAGPTPAELRKELAELPVQVRRQSWQIQFLVEELRSVSTDVERNVILDWLDDAKRKRNELESTLRERQALYEGLMRQRRRRTAGARHRPSAKGADAGAAVAIRAVSATKRG
ncbi:MAG: hypothetical protein U0610_30250 [bacterium]